MKYLKKAIVHPNPIIEVFTKIEKNTKSHGGSNKKVERFQNRSRMSNK